MMSLVYCVKEKWEVPIPSTSLLFLTMCHFSNYTKNCSENGKDWQPQDGRVYLFHFFLAYIIIHLLKNYSLCVYYVSSAFLGIKLITKEAHYVIWFLPLVSLREGEVYWEEKCLRTFKWKYVWLQVKWAIETACCMSPQAARMGWDVYIEGMRTELGLERWIK